MPHMQVDYSPNPENRLDVAGLCCALRGAAAATGHMPLAGVRVRAFQADPVVIADGNADHAFLDISVRQRGKWTEPAKAEAIARISAGGEACCAAVKASSSFMLLMEMRDIDLSLFPEDCSPRSVRSANPCLEAKHAPGDSSGHA
jgi:5-carboxymethyl-2-hydroxymuconate isomerase